MVSYFTGLNEKSLMQMLACPLAFVFVLSALKEGLVLSVVFPSGHSVQVSITDPSVDADAVPLVRDFQDRVFISVPQAAVLLKFFRWRTSRNGRFCRRIALGGHSRPLNWSRNVHQSGGSLATAHLEGAVRSPPNRSAPSCKQARWRGAAFKRAFH